MGFFSELKEDFSQAVSELGDLGEIDESDALLLQEDSSASHDAQMDETKSEGQNMQNNKQNKEEETMGLFNDDNVDKDLLDQILADETEGKEDEGIDAMLEAALSKDKATEEKEEKADKAEDTKKPETKKNDKADKEKKSDAKKDKKEEEVKIVPEKPDASLIENNDIREEANQQMAEERTNGTVTVITKGTIINGGISSDGSLEVMGTITGDVECLGKLSIIGNVSGNAIAAEIFVNTARLDGNLSSEGAVKIGVGTIVVGDIIGSSAVIAGAVKGDIDVNGPVVIDSTAIVQGNIKAKSIQVNNGAVVDGYTSLNYAGVDLKSFFEPEQA